MALLTYSFTIGSRFTRSSVANALPAISSGDGQPISRVLIGANKRFVFLEGTYNVTTKLTFTGSVPTDEQPNQWVGANADGTILRPKFDETGLRLDLTNYPLFVCSANVQMIDTEEHTYYKCLHFENTNASYSQGSIIEATSGDVDSQGWFGCNFKAAPADTSAVIMIAAAKSITVCICSTTNNFDKIINVTNNARVHNCRIIGGGTSSGSGNGDGAALSSQSSQFADCLITNCHGKGIHITAPTQRSTSILGIAQSSIMVVMA